MKVQWESSKMKAATPTEANWKHGKVNMELDNNFQCCASVEKKYRAKK